MLLAAERPGLTVEHVEVRKSEVVYAVTLHRLALGERGAKILRVVSGALLVPFGAVLLVAPDMLA